MTFCQIKTMRHNWPGERAVEPEGKATLAQLLAALAGLV